MYSVLLPVDDNTDRAMEAVKAVESLPNATEDVAVTILNVFESFEVADEAGQVTSDDIWEETEAPESVHAAIEYLEDAGIEVTEQREHGDPSEQIISVAADMDADSIIMSGQKRSPTGKALFGSVTQSVLVSANRPVMVTLEG